MTKVLPYLVIGLIKLLRLTCRHRALNDPRAEMRQTGRTCIYACLHAQQIASMLYNEPGLGAMVSRSKDGDLIAKALERIGVIPIRGSGGPTRKGGAAALRALVNHVERGRPAFLAVDGPKGPRGIVHPGVAMLSKKTRQPVIPLAMIPRRRLVLGRAWDRIQIPLPFTTIDGHFGDPLYARPGESVEAFTARIQQRLRAMQQEFDPREAEKFYSGFSSTASVNRAA